MIRQVDSVPVTHGFGIALIDGGRLQRIRSQGNSGATIMIEIRSRVAVSTRGVPQMSAAPVKLTAAPAVGDRAKSARVSRARTPSTSPAAEWLNLGFNCGGAVLAWVGVVGLTSLAPVTGGVSAFGAAFLYGGALAATSQCAVSTYRTSNIYRERTDINDAMDKSSLYQGYSMAADGIGLVGARGAIIELKVAHAAIVESGIGWRTATRLGMSRPIRRRLTVALELNGAKRVEGLVINRLVRQRLLDGIAAALGLVASSTSGLIMEAVVWITDETHGLARHAP